MTLFYIIVPTRNSFILLPDLIHSLQIQTYPNWRVLFIDGQSESDHIEFLNSICDEDPRFTWKPQTDKDTGIFGAMNEGLSAIPACYDHWFLFWGSDDRASNPLMLALVADRINSYTYYNDLPDLIVCSGVYYRSSAHNTSVVYLTRKTTFKLLNTYRQSMFMGLTPPHQATFFGFGAVKLLPTFSTDLRLASDLDYFLRLSEFPNIKVVSLNDNVVMIGDGGISNNNTKDRLLEVYSIYRNMFKSLWFIPFVFRYLRRVKSKLKCA